MAEVGLTAGETLFRSDYSISWHRSQSPRAEGKSNKLQQLIALYIVRIVALAHS
jgi:hypothetical protein